MSSKLEKRIYTWIEFSINLLTAVNLTFRKITFQYFLVWVVFDANSLIFIPFSNFGLFFLWFARNSKAPAALGHFSISFLGTYHSERFLVPLWEMRNDFGQLKIVGHQFSASGDGKSVADGFNAIMKRNVSSYVQEGGSAKTPKEFANALVQ